MKAVTNPQVTVLMAVYNGGKYLKSSVQSVLNQTFRDFEFLIVNDCSTDDSVEIIESFNDKRVIIYHNEKNIGQTKSLNVGLRLAKGKYIARMDADDMAFPMWLEKLVNFILNHAEYEVVGPGAVVIDAENRIKNTIISPEKNDTIILSIFCDTPVNHVGSIMNKEAIINLGGYNELFLIKQDYELWSSLIRKNRKITSIPDLLVAVRVHETSLTTVESDRGLTEYAQTVYENIKCLTNLNISYNEALKLAKFRLKPYNLHADEFYQAIETFVKIYENLKNNIEKKLLKEYIKSQIIKTYCRRALAEVNNHQLKNARKTSRECLKKYGFYLIPFTIILSSFLGVNAVHWTYGIYQKILRLKARSMLYTQHKSLKLTKFENA